MICYLFSPELKWNFLKAFNVLAVPPLAHAETSCDDPRQDR